MEVRDVGPHGSNLALHGAGFPNLSRCGLANPAHEELGCYPARPVAGAVAIIGVGEQRPPELIAVGAVACPFCFPHSSCEGTALSFWPEADDHPSLTGTTLAVQVLLLGLEFGWEQSHQISMQSTSYYNTLVKFTQDS